MPARVITPQDIQQKLRDLQAQYPGFVLRADRADDRCRTIGTTLHVPQDWPKYAPANQWVRLSHEEIHLRDYARYGTIGFLLRYLWPSWRWYFESEAFTVEMRAVVEAYGTERLHEKRQGYIDTLSGADYYWMRSRAAVTQWVDATIAGLVGG